MKPSTIDKVSHPKNNKKLRFHGKSKYKEQESQVYLNELRKTNARDASFKQERCIN